jgi:hypothetical protein
MPRKPSDDMVDRLPLVGGGSVDPRAFLLPLLPKPERDEREAILIRAAGLLQGRYGIEFAEELAAMVKRYESRK